MSIDLKKLEETTNPAELLKILKKWDLETQMRYRTIHREWEKDCLFFLGKQWLEEKNGTENYLILEDDDDHFRPVTNYTARLADLKKSQVLGRNIRMRVKPNSNNKKDVDSSRLADLMLKAKHLIDNEEEVQEQVFLHSQIFGIGWRSDYKKLLDYIEQQEQELGDDPEMGEIEEEPGIDLQALMMGESPMEQQNFEPSLGDGIPTQEGYDSEIGEPIASEPQQEAPRVPVYTSAVDVIDPFRIRVSASRLEKDIQWLDDASIQPVEWIKDQFNIEAEGYNPNDLYRVKETKVLPRGLQLSEDFKHIVMQKQSSTRKDAAYSDAKRETTDHVTILHKSYFAPNKTYMKGRLLIWTEQVVIYDGSPDVPNNPRLKKWYPHTPFNFKPHPLRFEGISFQEDLIPLNKKINSLDSMIMEHIDKTASPERIEYEGTIMNNNDNSDGIIRVKPKMNMPNGGIPSYLQHPQMSNEVYRMRDNLVAEMEKIAGVTEVVQGLRPAGVDTYKGLRLLREAADSADSNLYKSWHRHLRKSMQLKLALMQECIVRDDEELREIMKSVSENESMGDLEIKAFLGQELRNNINVVIEEGDYVSQSKDAEADQVVSYLGSGILTPEKLGDPYTQLKILRRLGMGHLPMPDKVDIEKAERIIELIEGGQSERVTAIIDPVRDNLGLFLRVWSEWIKTSRFESLDPEIQTFTKDLLTQTEQYLINLQQPDPGMEEGLPPGAGGAGMPMGEQPPPPTLQ